ncbi:MAG: DUF3488 domain-containing transglutaminase family protein [bacterium]|nr:DUF3488 domain-containing transglutaminase family protein [bacterium]
MDKQDKRAFAKRKIFRRKSPTLPPLPLSKEAVSWLMFSLVLSISWHIPHTPIWTLAAVAVVLIWRFRMITGKSPEPPKLLKYALTIGVIIGVVITYRSFMGRDPGTTALILLSTLKLLELKSQRDFMFVIFLCYFLVFGNFLYSQSIPALLFMMVAFVLITAAVLRMNHGGRYPVRADAPEAVRLPFLLKSGARFFLLSLPFMAVMFFLFPRTSGPLWNIPQDNAAKARSGFRDSVYPGQFAELAQSNVIAFRVTFDNGVPPQRDLYFRGLVLWFSNGRGWFQGIIPSIRGPEPLSGKTSPVSYTVALEPHFQRWAFALDIPLGYPRRSRHYPGHVFQFWQPVKTPVQYRVSSTLSPDFGDRLNRRYRGWALMLPRQSQPRLEELAERLRAGTASGSDAETVQAALDYLAASGFTYSLTPGVMDRHSPFEDFLFNKRTGFCEHFAGAFTLLMRIAGIPARMVLGYQGGEFNAVGGYLLVRQSDAHAWCEVWLEKEGWRRVDPTAAISPDRIEYGLEISRRLSDLGPLEGKQRTDAINRAMSPNFFKRLFRTLEQHWDNVNNKWNLWIMSYDRYRQRDIIKSLGFPAVRRWNLLIAVVVLTVLLFFLVSGLVKRHAIASDPLAGVYRRFCKKTSKKGIKPRSWEGPLDFRDRAMQFFPLQAEEIKQISDNYIRLRYGREGADDRVLKELKQRVRRFRPARQRDNTGK